MHEVSKSNPCRFLNNYNTLDVIAVEAALCAESKGTLFVDNTDNPETFLLWNESDGFYLAADSVINFEQINQTIAQILDTRNTGNSEFVLYIDPKYDSVAGSVLPVQKCEKLGVLSYHYPNPSEQAIKSINGFDVVNIDRSFFNSSYQNSEMVLETIEQTWNSTDAFLKSGFGTAVIHVSDSSVAAFCVTEHVTKTSAEFSIETMPEFQQKGLATLAGANMLSLCSQQSKDAYWYCTPDNKASMHLAEKLGFKHKSSFHVWLFEY